MIIVSLISIDHHTFLEFFSWDENFKIYSLSNFQMYNTELKNFIGV